MLLYEKNERATEDKTCNSAKSTYEVETDEFPSIPFDVRFDLQNGTKQENQHTCNKWTYHRNSAFLPDYYNITRSLVNKQSDAFSQNDWNKV